MNEVMETTKQTDGTFRVSTGKGSTNHAVSSQWYARPDDQRFLNLTDLAEYVNRIRAESFADVIDVRDIRVIADDDKPESLGLEIPTSNKRASSDVLSVAPTHWSFGQLCSLAGAPAGYLRKLPSVIAGINLQYAVANLRSEAIKTYVRENGRTELRAATGPEYGRIYDADVVRAVQRIAGNGIGDTHWKVPGVFDWRTMIYNPHAEITKQSTTLFASDRDVFLFLVDDTHPIEIGKLDNGEPDLIFRGFYVWNSEVGSKTLGVATMYLRGVCQNRILWGVEGYQEITLRHSKGAPDRFAAEVGPALESFSHAGTSKLLTGIKAAQAAIVADNETKRSEWLVDQGFTRPQSREIIASVVREEGKQPRSVWDFVQGITATARDIPHQDDRVTFEKMAGKLLSRVKA